MEMVENAFFKQASMPRSIWSKSTLNCSFNVVCATVDNIYSSWTNLPVGKVVRHFYFSAIDKQGFTAVNVYAPGQGTNFILRKRMLAFAILLGRLAPHWHHFSTNFSHLVKSKKAFILPQTLGSMFSNISNYYETGSAKLFPVPESTDYIHVLNEILKITGHFHIHSNSGNRRNLSRFGFIAR